MKFSESIIKLFFPEDITCIACNGEMATSSEYGLCGECSVNKNTRFCVRCGRGITGEGDYCYDCQNRKRFFDCARSPLIYENVSQLLIHRFKIGGKRYLSKYMARFMLDTFSKEDWKVDFITYVPISDKNKKIRGFNQSELLAVELSALINLPVKGILEKSGGKEDSTELGKKSRIEAIKDTIKVVEKPKGESILLIDDVFTTGSTADECARVLKKAGAKKVYVLTFATSVCKPIVY